MPRTPQPLHILRKDIVHLWPEIVVVLALFFSFAVSTGGYWEGSPYAVIVQLVNFLLHVVMPISWLVVISRLIHDEPLVGNRQFWTSRPYHWANLLAAKILFLLIFLYLPFFLMQCILLKQAGLYPTTALPQLGQNLLLLTVVFILPITALAAVTGTFTRLLLSLIGGVIYLLIAFGLIVFLVFEKMRPDSMNHSVVALFAILPLVALVYQYATRNTRVSVGILLVTPLVLILAAGAIPFGAIARHSYASPGSSDPTLADLPAQFRMQEAQPGRLVEFRGENQVEVPFSIAKADKDSAYLIRGVQATIAAPGVHWTSGYSKPLEEQQIGSGSPFGAVSLPIPKAIFDKVKDSPADVHLTLLTDHLKVDPVSTWKATDKPFSIPGHGVCAYPADEASGNPTCRFAVKGPEFLLVSAKLAPGSCTAGGTPTIPGQARLGPASGLPNFFDPVDTEPLNLQTGDPDKKHQYALCPGTPLNFLAAGPAGKVAFDLDVKQIKLDSYAMRFRPRSEAAPPPAPDQQ